MQEIQGTILKSVGTVRNYEARLVEVARWTQAEKIAGGLRAMTPELATRYLEHRGQEVGQSTLNMSRQAMQCMFTHVTGKLQAGEKLPVIKSEKDQALTGRAYTPSQAHLVGQHQTERNSLATELAHAAGLRAHELLTLRPATERPADQRPAAETKFQGREGMKYTVHGKGGLVREVLIPQRLAERLEANRLPEPVKIVDRNINYTQHYNVAGGKIWSQSFSNAANRSLGWSAGAHGLRHSYAQQRMDELQKLGHSRDTALLTVSQELGHFRPEITEVYLR